MIKPPVIFIATLGLAGFAVAPRASADQLADQPADRSIDRSADRSADRSMASSASSVATLDAPDDSHPNPRLKVSYRHFAISNVDFTRVPLQGVELDGYPLSMRWFRSGIEAEMGTGRADVNQNPVNVWYGLLGLSAGFQYPARVTPFIEGRFVGGALGGNLQGAVTVPGTTTMLSGTSAVTWMLGRGIDVGAEVFTVGRAYVSASIGWLHTTWHGIDYAAFMLDETAPLRTKDLTYDSFTFKLGVGI